MKRTVQIIAMVLLLAAPWVAKADTDTLTVADGTASNGYVPIYGYWADANQHQQMIYPASMLTDMVGQNIVGMNFFVSGGWYCTATVSFAIVTDSVFSSSNYITAPLTMVWSGSWTSGTMPTSFNNAFPYTGGNLLVDIVTVAGGYSASSATGISRTGASIRAYGSNTPTIEGFLPKAEFYYNNETFCFSAGAPQLVSATTSSLTFSWAPSSTAIEYEVMVDDSLIGGLTDTILTVNGLNASSLYAVSVRAICGVDDSSSWTMPVTMATTCAAIANLPWSTGFEGETDGEVPLCWTRTVPLVYTDWYGDTNYAPYVYDYNYYSHNGSASLYFYAYSGYNLISGQAVIASPYIAHNPADLHVTFWASGYNMDEGDTLWAGIMTDPNADSTFIPLTAITAEEFGYGTYETNYMQFEFYTGSLADSFSEGDSVCIAFRAAIGQYNYSMTLNIDDIVVDAMGDCLAPTLNSGSIDSISYEGVQLSWECSVEADGFDVMLVSQSGDTLHFPCTEDSLLIETGLVGDMPYNAYAATLCGGDTTSYTLLGTFTTHQRCYPVQGLTVAATTANAAALAWTYSNNGIEPGSTTIVVTDNTDTTAAPIELTVTGTSAIFTGLAEGHLYTATFLTFCDDDTSRATSVNFMPHTAPCAEFTGTGTSSYIPFYSYYNNGFSEMLYSGTEFAGFDTVSGLSFQIANTVNRNNVIDIWMGYLPDSITSLSTSAYLSVDSMTHVVSNYTFSSANSGWMDMIPFDTLFATQPTGNVVIAVYNHTGSWTSGLVWATHNSTVGNSVYWYTDNTVNPRNPSGSNNTVAMAANIQVYGNCGGGDCAAPGASVESADTNSITLTWLPGGDESSWNVLYREAGDDTWINAGPANTVPFTITGLNPGTDYQFRVGSDCGDTIVYGNAINGSTLCGIMHATFSIAPTGENNCWTYLGNGYYSTYGSYYYIYNGGTIMTPVIGDTISNLQVRLNVYGAPYSVGVCDANGQNITWIDTVDPGDNYNFHYIKTYLHNYTGTGTNIIIKASNGYYYTYMNQIVVEPLDDCMPVFDLAIDSVTTTDAWLSWTSDGTNFLVKYMDEADTTQTWLSATSTTNSIHLTGMNSNTRYQVKVFNVCSATSQSDSATARVIMGCTPYATPFFEGFGHDEMPVCWTNVTSGNIYTTFDQTAGYGYDYVYSYGPYSSAGQTDWLMTPEIQVPANADNYRFLYYIGGGAYTYTGYPNSLGAYDLYVSTTGSGDTSLYTTLLLSDTLNSRTSNGTTLNLASVSLTPYAGQTVSFAFRARTKEYGAVYLTNVEARFAGEPSYYLSGNGTVFVGDTNTYVANRLEGALDSMTYQWTSTMAAAGHAVMTGATTDTMQIRYTAEGIDTLTFIATNQFGSDTSVGVVHVYHCTPISEFPFHDGFEALSPCYTLVYGDGNPNTNTMLVTDDMGYNLDSVHEGNSAFRFSSFSSKDDYNQYLISRELNGTNMVLSFWYAKYNSNSTEKFRVGHSSTNRDTNSFTWGPWMGDSLSETQWKQYTDSLPEGTKFFAIQYWGNYAYYVYIDDLTITGESGCRAPVITGINREESSLTINFQSDADSVEVLVTSGTFNPEATGVVVSGNSYTATGLTHSTVYTVALRALCGDGVISDWAVDTASTLVVNCGVPTGLAVSENGYTSTTFGWTAAGDEHGWELQVYNTIDTFSFTATETSATATGLTPGQTYNARVRAMCGQNADIEGDWSEPLTFTTEVCEPVTGLNVVSVDGTTVQLAWNAASTGTGSYRVEYGYAGFDQGHGLSATATSASITLEGLDANTMYDAYVANICTESIISAWSQPVSFETANDNGIADVDAEGNLSIYPNPASSVVTIRVSEMLADAAVAIVDLNGRTVKSLALQGNSATFDVSQLAKGAYFVRLTGEQATTVRKLIVK